MRRPLKPFVTEYKGTRRQAPGSQAGGLQAPGLQTPRLQASGQPASEPLARHSEARTFESERSRARFGDAATREEPDDSYEAAMRAADALFAQPAPQPTPRPLVTAFDAAADGPHSDASNASPIAPDRGGRILRALDEPPPPQLAALEAAHAPKRRGRKPGSKNKPKAGPAEPAGVELTDAAPTGLFAGEVSDAAAPPTAPTRQTDTTQPDTTQPDTRQATTRQAATRQAAGTEAQRRLEAIPIAYPPSNESPSNESPSNGSKRFNWVRDRLKPGEGWKRRRLPRICW